MDSTVIVLSCFSLMLFLLLMKVPVGFGMFFVGTLGFAWLKSPEIAMYIIPRIVFEQMAAYHFIIISLFMVTGALVMKADVAPAAFEFARKCVGHLRGGMAMATFLVNGLYSKSRLRWWIHRVLVILRIRKKPKLSVVPSYDKGADKYIH